MRGALLPLERLLKYLSVLRLECSLGSYFVRFVRCLLSIRLGLHMCLSKRLVRTKVGRNFCERRA